MSTDNIFVFFLHRLSLDRRFTWNVNFENVKNIWKKVLLGAQELISYLTNITEQKALLENKMSISEEYGAFKVVDNLYEMSNPVFKKK